MKSFTLLVFSFFLVVSTANAAEPLLLASVKDNYIYQQIIQQNLDDKYLRTVLKDSMDMLAVDISLDNKEQQLLNNVKPILNADQPDLGTDSF